MMQKNQEVESNYLQSNLSTYESIYELRIKFYFYDIFMVFSKTI